MRHPVLTLAVCSLALAAGAVVAATTPLSATAKLAGKAGSNVMGSVTFTENGGKVSIDAHVMGLAAGMHGFHIHEKGDCGDAEFKNAGGHFNPTSEAHGAPADAHHHAGDLGNIEIDEKGHGMLEISTAMLTVSPGPNSVIGRAVIVHEKADDLKTQPTGDAGGRMACGVVNAGQ